MVLEEEQLSFWAWLGISGLLWLMVLTGVCLLVGLGAFILGAIRRGPARALGNIGQAITGVVQDWTRTSPRRVLALARLAMQESFRRRVIVVFVLFVVVLLFAVLFLGSSSQAAAKTYVTFIFAALSYLMLAVSIILSAFSLPADIKDRTIYTVLSKPVRRHEMILGRVLGFAATGTLLLGAMGVVSYLFIIRGLNHSHKVALEGWETRSSTDPDDPNPIRRIGTTAAEHGHRHQIIVRADNTVEVDDGPGHTHLVTLEDVQGKPVYQFSSPVGLLKARVPVYGELTFYDRQGNQATDGINVGKEWEYRKCIEGGTGCKAEWIFPGITRDRFLLGLPFELTTGVFRTHKGDNLEERIYGNLTLVNPSDPTRRTRPKRFESREYYTDKFTLGEPRRDANDQPVLLDRDGNTVPYATVLQELGLTAEAGQDQDRAVGPDELGVIISAYQRLGYLPDIVVDGPSGPISLFRDLVEDGKLMVEIRCEERGQFFCMAGPDLYLRATDVPFWWNFIKGHVGIWLQMVLVITAGVAWSTILRGPVALVATVATTVAGFCTEFMRGIYLGETPGGGPVESLIRIIRQENPIVELKDAPQEAIEVFDTFLGALMFAAERMVPDFLAFNDSNFVAQGFDISPERIGQHVLSALAFVVPVIIAGHFGLRSRQVAE